MRRGLVGWRRPSPQAAFAFPPPRRPSAAELEAAGDAFEARLLERLFVVPSPWDARIRYDASIPDPARRFRLVESESSLTRPAFRALFTRFADSALRRPGVQVAQMSLNLNLVTEEDAVLNLLPPLLSPSWRRWPGPMVCGRFPFRNWPRALNVAVEWEDEDRDWVMRRGEPLVCVLVQFDDPALAPTLVEAENTPELARHIRHVDNVGMYGRNTTPMFRDAARRRPARLLTPKGERCSGSS